MVQAPRRSVRARAAGREGPLLQLVYYGYVAGSRLALALPERWAYGLAQVAGGIAARRSRRRGQVAANLGRIVGAPADSERVQRLVVDAYRSYARYWLETFRLVREGRGFWLERTHSPTAAVLDAALARGKGAVVVVGHLGNWDAAGAWVGARGGKLVTVAEVLRPRRLFEFFLRHRAKLGMTIYAAEPGVTARLVEEAENGAVVAILGDRDLKGTGLEIDFFGEPATFPVGAASVALRAGVPLLVAGVFERQLADGRRGWVVEFTDPVEVPGDPGVAELTRAAVARLEAFVARHPEQWHVFQPFWLADRGPRRT
ncbi:MAG TPA: phosphatidylinositol mannoside acyltransferase [Actinomycetota bacterium]|nr:phosphatidylinositol mannoside acyltransferase [Actinomycetota bacterium]